MTPRVLPTIDLYHVAPIRMTVADCVTELLDELPRVGRIGFRRLTEDLVERLEVVLRFLALLEMYKQGWIELEQLDRFGEIEVIWVGEDALVGAGGPSFSVDDYEG